MTFNPTPEQIEAALNAYSSKGLEIDGYDPYDSPLTYEGWGERFTSQMRAALVAAASAAPQEPNGDDCDDPEECPACDTPVDKCSRDNVCCWDCNHADGWAPERPPIAAPVQVDEAKLAEIAHRVDAHEWSRIGGTYGDQVAEIVSSALRGDAPQESHDCNACQDCASSPGHNRCCGCYDGVCCKEQPSAEVRDALVSAIADELETDDGIAESWSAGKLQATARRLVAHAIVPTLNGDE